MINNDKQIATNTICNKIDYREIVLPLSSDLPSNLRIGEIISLSGTIYTARDAAHKLIVESLAKGDKLPFELSGNAIYYCGPSPTKAGEIIGSCGPTTSARMDDYTPQLLENGLKVMIGKGDRSPLVQQSITKHHAVYLCAVGGAAALMKSCVTSCEVVAYPQLGCEAVHKLTVKNMKLVVFNK